MHGFVEEAVGRHDTIGAGAAHPVILIVGIPRDAQILDTTVLGNQVAVGPLGAVAAQVVTSTLHLAHVHVFRHFSCIDVKAHDRSGAADPDLALGVEHVVVAH